MKADLDECGILNIRAETPIEAYALNQWGNANFSTDGNIKNPNIVVHTRLDFPEEPDVT